MKRGWIFVLMAVAAVFCGSSDRAIADPEVKYVILCIGDGMQLEHEIAYSRYMTGRDRRLVWDLFPVQVPTTTWDVTTYNRYALIRGVPSYDPGTFNPVVGYDPSQGGTRPYPDDPSGDPSYFLTLLPLTPGGTPAAPATDSASAGTAMATGVKTDDGNIAWLPGDPADGALTTIAESMRRQKGASIGVITTVPFNHATPACFVGHNVNRNNYYTGYKGYTGLGLADEIITRVKPDVVIGAGHTLYTNPTWNTTKGYISQTVYATLKADGEYVVAERQTGVDGWTTLAAAAETAVVGRKKLFGLYGGAIYNPLGGAYNSDLFEPPLPSNTPGAPSIRFDLTAPQDPTENPTLAQATRAALRVLGRNRNGCFLMVEGGDIDWANHANDYRWMIGAMWQFHEAVKAVIDHVGCPGNEMTWSNTLVIVTADHGNSYMRLTGRLGKGELPSQTFNATTKLWEYLPNEVTYGTMNHTNEMVMLYAMGRGAFRFLRRFGDLYPRTAIVDNTDVYRVMAEAAGVSE